MNEDDDFLIFPVEYLHSKNDSHNKSLEKSDFRVGVVINFYFGD